MTKKTVELRPSKIRRDPAPTHEPIGIAGSIWWASRKGEIWLAIAGIIFFAAAISAFVIDVAQLWPL